MFLFFVKKEVFFFSGRHFAGWIVRMDFCFQGVFLGKSDSVQVSYYHFIFFLSGNELVIEWRHYRFCSISVSLLGSEGIGDNVIEQQQEIFRNLGFFVKTGEKSIHSKESIRFAEEVLKVGPWHKRVLEEGLKLEFEKEPGKYREANNKSALENLPVLKEKVEEWLQGGHVEKLDSPAWCTNPMTVAVKYDPIKGETKMRPCIDLSRYVNKHLKKSHVKMDDLTVAEELIEQGDFMASFDLANQFFHVQLHQDDRKYFGFALPREDGGEDYYQFRVMAYGFSTAVEVVTRLLRPVKAYLHKMGVKLSIFVDDGRVSGAEEKAVWKQFQFVLEVLQLNGWNIQWKKTSTAVSRVLLHLGFITDSVQMKYFLPVEKEKLVIDLIQRVVRKGMEGLAVEALELASLLGKLNSMRRSHGHIVSIMTRSCQHLMGKAVLEEGWNTSLLLNYEAVRELQYLLEKLEELNGQFIPTQEARSKVVELKEVDNLVETIKMTGKDVDNLFVSDASDQLAFVYRADGGFLAVREFEFSQQERSASSGFRELLAVKKMLQQEPQQFQDFRGGKVFWQTDSKNTYIFLSRGSRKPVIQDAVVEIKDMERQLGVSIVPVWMPRTQERIVLADMGSKLHSSTDEWCVEREILATLFNSLDFVPEVDCCATSRNSICGVFFFENSTSGFCRHKFP